MERVLALQEVTVTQHSVAEAEVGGAAAAGFDSPNHRSGSGSRSSNAPAGIPSAACTLLQQWREKTYQLMVQQAAAALVHAAELSAAQQAVSNKGAELEVARQEVQSAEAQARLNQAAAAALREDLDVVHAKLSHAETANAKKLAAVAEGQDALNALEAEARSLRARAAALEAGAAIHATEADALASLLAAAERKHAEALQRAAASEEALSEAGTAAVAASLREDQLERRREEAAAAAARSDTRIAALEAALAKASQDAAAAAADAAAALAKETAAVDAALAEAAGVKATLASKESQVALLEAKLVEDVQKSRAEAAELVAATQAEHAAALDSLRGKVQTALSDCSKAEALQRQAEWERKRGEEKAANEESVKVQDLSKRLHEAETQLRLVSTERNLLACNLRKVVATDDRLLQVQDGVRRRATLPPGSNAERSLQDAVHASAAAPAEAAASPGRRHGAISWVSAPPAQPALPHPPAAAEDKGLANGDVASDADAQPRADTLELLRADSRAGAPQQSVWTSAHSARSLLQISADLLGAD